MNISIPMKQQVVLKSIDFRLSQETEQLNKEEFIRLGFEQSPITSNNPQYNNAGFIIDIGNRISKTKSRIKKLNLFRKICVHNKNHL